MTETVQTSSEETIQLQESQTNGLPAPPVAPVESMQKLPQEVEQVRRAELKRMRTIATSLLVAAAVIFLLIHRKTGFWWDLLEAVSEASMVGALADWFAVTALFRHPLGIPIPHTAIIPHEKRRIGRSLGSFVQRHFLTPQNVEQEILKVDIAELVGQWLVDPENPVRVTRAVLERAPLIVERLNDDRIRAFLNENISSRIRQSDFSTLQKRIVTTILNEDNPQWLVETFLKQAATIVDQNEATIINGIRNNISLVARVFRVPEKAVDHTQALLHDMLERPDHPTRRLLVAALIRTLRRQRTISIENNWIDRVKNTIATHPETRQVIGEIWTRFIAEIKADLNSEDSHIRAYARQFISDIGRQILNDRSFQKAINDLVRDAIVGLARSHGTAIVQMIENRVSTWSDEDIVDRIELSVGRDLQFIRINGTLVGGIVGGLLYILSYVLG